MRVAWHCYGKHANPMPEPGRMMCKVAIIGGGAAGLMAALSSSAIWSRAVSGMDNQPARTFSGNQVIPVLILEKQDRVGKKLLATGNGQCNLSHLQASIRPYHGQDSHFADAALQQLDVPATVDLFHQLGLKLVNEPDGRIYPYSRQAAAVLDILRLAARQRGVFIETGFQVDRVDPAGRNKGEESFDVHAANGWTIRAERVILASGGLAAPSLGADGSGFAIMTRLGHRVTDCYPALVPVRTAADFVRGLAGSKFDGTVTVAADGRRLDAASGEILFTDYGLSGPPILQISRSISDLLRKSQASQIDVILDLLPDITRSELHDWLVLRRDIDLNLELSDYLTGLVNKKIGQAVLKRCLGYPLNQPVSILDKADLDQLSACLKAWPIKITGTRDWHQAQVTAGGLDSRDFHPETLESRLIPGLFAAGEVLDVDGDCGGFNLQWAWSSGCLAGQQAMKSCLAQPLAGQSQANSQDAASVTR
jgi:predicted Rossmann fold flavoprotein